MIEVWDKMKRPNRHDTRDVNDNETIKETSERMNKTVLFINIFGWLPQLFCRRFTAW